MWSGAGLALVKWTWGTHGTPVSPMKMMNSPSMECVHTVPTILVDGYPVCEWTVQSTHLKLDTTSVKCTSSTLSACFFQVAKLFIPINLDMIALQNCMRTIYMEVVTCWFDWEWAFVVKETCTYSCFMVSFLHCMKVHVHLLCFLVIEPILCLSFFNNWKCFGRTIKINHYTYTHDHIAYALTRPSPIFYSP